MGINMTEVSGKRKTEYNMTFGLLAGLAIVMVVAGHLGYEIMTVGGLFPYYSFHVPLFLFISGYFYRENAEEHPAAYMKKKIVRLLLPYFIWNLVYGLFAYLLRAKGFTMGEEIGIRTLFLAPFLHGYQFIYNYAAWFVPVLFVVEMMNLFMRILMRRLIQVLPHRRRSGSVGQFDEGQTAERQESDKQIVERDLVGRQTVERDLVGKQTVERDLVGKQTVERDLVGRQTVERDLLGKQTVERDLMGKQTDEKHLVEGQAADGQQDDTGAVEWLYLCGSLLVGILVVSLAIGGHVWGNYKAPGRILFLYPCFQMGRFYKKRVERYDTVGNLPYFAVLLTVQVILHICCNGLAFSSVWCTGFANGPVIPYVTVVSGIAFWLRIARILAPLTESCKLIRYVGQHTYTVMMHHVLVFMLVKMLLAGLAASTGFCADFAFEQFYTNIDYIYLVNGAEHFKMVYLAAGIMLPLGVKHIGERIRAWKS